MIGIWVLLGLGVLAGVAGIFDGDSTPPVEDTADGTSDVGSTDAPDTSGINQMLQAVEVPGQSQGGLDSEDDLVLGENLQPGLTAFLNEQVALGEQTQEQADAVLAVAQFEAAPMNVDTGAGEDVVIGQGGDDTIATGSGEDIVLGGTGDDLITLGDDDDAYGVQSDSPEDLAENAAGFGFLGNESSLERGNDTVFGNRGNDDLNDGFGSDFLDGGNGNDRISALDQRGLDFDTVVGGLGNDTILVDQGDLVSTGTGEDDLIVDVDRAALAEPYAPTVVQDFDLENDQLLLEVDGAKPLVTTAPLADGAGTSVLVDEVEVIQLLGVDELPLEAIQVEVTIDPISQPGLTELFGSEPDQVVAEELRDAVVAQLDELVAAGELTQDEADAELSVIEFRDSPLSIATEGGNDGVVTGSGADTVDAGRGSDFVLGSAGDDSIRLGDGADFYADVRSTDEGLTGVSPLFVPADDAPGGNDTVDGGSGNDFIVDFHGSNLLEGRSGDDVIDSRDSDGLTPDVVRGGPGVDTLRVDQGDVVNGGDDGDTVIVDLTNGFVTGFQVVTYNDFVRGEDTLILESDAIFAEAPAVTVLPNAAGTGSLVLLAGIPVIDVVGAADLTVDDVVLNLIVPAAVL